MIDQALVQQRLDQVVWDFMEIKNNEFFSFLLSNLKYSTNDRIPTACTNGVEIKFGSDFLLKCSREEAVGVMYHELQHVLYNHVPIAKEMNLDFRVHNIAADHYNNLEAQQQGYVLPHFIEPFRDPKFKGWSSMEIYDYLMDEENEDEKNKALGEMGDGLGGDMEELPEDMTSEEAREMTEEAVIKSVMQADMAGAPGSVPGDARRLYEEVTAPKVNWWNILLPKMNKYRADDWTYRKPRRRVLQQGLTLPTMWSECVGSMAFGFDVSGSMSDEALGLCVAVSKNIREMLKPEKVHIMCFDTEVHECGELGPRDPFTNVELVGGGGTDVNPFLEMCIEKKPDIMICFTDGGFYAPPAQHDLPAADLYWVLTESPYCKELKGTQIRMDRI
jgi:predicted metal-dependent peptidase